MVIQKETLALNSSYTTYIFPDNQIDQALYITQHHERVFPASSILP